MWTSNAIYNEYKEIGVHQHARRSLIMKVKEHFKEDILELSSTRIAGVLLFRSKASDVLRIVEDKEDDVNVEKVAKHTTMESHKTWEHPTLS